jgi:transposase
VRLPVERVNRVVQYIPVDCERCQAPLPNEAGANDPPSTWHQVAEFPAVAATVTEHQGHGRQCACCGHVTWGKIPEEIRAHGFGPKLAAAVVFLSSRCHGTKRVVEEIVETLFGVPISLGSISNLEAEAATVLAPAHAQAEQAVRQAPVKNADETGWSIGGKLCWLWMAATNWVAYFKISAGRGQVNFRELLGSLARL